MSDQKMIRSRKEFPDTHCFVYKNKHYPFKISYFNLCSNYFLRNSEQIQFMQDIELIDEEIGVKLNIEEDIINKFIKYVQKEEISVDNDNVISLHYLSKRFEVEEL